jgi:hypothetical protein
MTDRKALDRPAAITAAAIGLLLILVSVPFLSSDDVEGHAGAYTIAWSETDYKAATGTQAAAGVERVLNFTIDSVNLSNITLVITCTDNRGPNNLAAAAQVRWTLTFLNRTPIEGNACGVNERYNVSAHPDVGSISASSAEQAVTKIWTQNAANNVSGEAKLTFRWTRAGPAGPLPVPPQGTSFTASLALGSQMWAATANAISEEVNK